MKRLLNLGVVLRAVVCSHRTFFFEICRPGISQKCASCYYIIDMQVSTRATPKKLTKATTHSNPWCMLLNDESSWAYEICSVYRLILNLLTCFWQHESIRSLCTKKGSFYVVPLFSDEDLCPINQNALIIRRWKPPRVRLWSAPLNMQHFIQTGKG